MFTCFYSMPPSQLFQHRAQAQHKPYWCCTQWAGPNLEYIWKSKESECFLPQCIFRDFISHRDLWYPPALYLTYLSCCLQPAWLGWQRISPACWTPWGGLVFHPIPELSLAPWKKLSHDVLSLCFPALVVVQCCGFWSSAHLVVLQNTQVHISL